MKKVKIMTQNPLIVSEKDFKIELENGTSSPIKLLIDNGEWVMQGDSAQRLCKSELRAILKMISLHNQELQKYEKENAENEEEKGYIGYREELEGRMAKTIEYAKSLGLSESEYKESADWNWSKIKKEPENSDDDNEDEDGDNDDEDNNY